MNDEFGESEEDEEEPVLDLKVQNQRVDGIFPLYIFISFLFFLNVGQGTDNDEDESNDDDEDDDYDDDDNGNDLTAKSKDLLF